MGEGKAGVARIRVGVGLSLLEDSVAAGRQATSAAMEQAGLEHAGWALCFFSTHHMHRADVLQRTVLEQTGCLAMAGCSAPGVIGAGQEVEGKPGVVVMVGLGRSMHAHSTLLTGEGHGFAELNAPAGSTTLLLPDAYRVNTEILERRLAAQIPGANLFGAGAADDGTLGICLQMGLEGVRSASIAALTFTGDYQLATGITQSCRMVGDPHFITGCHDYILSEIDGRPAVHAFMDQGEALGLEDMQATAERVLFGFPLNPTQPEFTGEKCIVRPLGGFDQASSGLVVPYPMQPHGTVAFMLRDSKSAEQDMQRMVLGLQEAKHWRPDFGVYFNCAARGESLYGRPGADLEVIRDYLGNFPLIGLNGGFEVATVLEQARIYTYTGVLLLFRAGGEE